jgi:hypothetical protein
MEATRPHEITVYNKLTRRHIQDDILQNHFVSTKNSEEGNKTPSKLYVSFYQTARRHSGVHCHRHAAPLEHRFSCAR